MQIGLLETESRDIGQFSPFVRRRQLSREDNPDSGRGGWTEGGVTTARAGGWFVVPCTRASSDGRRSLRFDFTRK